MRVSVGINAPGAISRAMRGERLGPEMDTRMKLALARAGVLARQAFLENFVQGGRPTWAPLKESTMREKLRLYQQGIIRGRKPNTHRVQLTRPQPNAPGALFTLIRSGLLRDSTVRRGVTGNITRINPTQGTLVVGTNVPYGIYHQEGRPARNLPARPFLTVTEEELDFMMDEIGRILLDLDNDVAEEAF